jgi:hypothetical protein
MTDTEIVATSDHGLRSRAIFRPIKAVTDEDLCRALQLLSGVNKDLARIICEYCDVPVTMVIAVLDKSASMGATFTGMTTGYTRELYQRELVRRVMSGQGLEEEAAVRPCIGSVVHFGSDSSILMSPRLEDCCPKCLRCRDDCITDTGVCDTCGVAGKDFVRLFDLGTQPLERGLSPAFAATFVERDKEVASNSGTNFNEALGRVKDCVGQYGHELKIHARAKTIPIHYVVLFCTDGEDSGASLRKLTIMNGVSYPMVSVIVAPHMAEASKKALTDVSDVVCCSTNVNETAERVRQALLTAMRKTERVAVQNNDTNDFYTLRKATPGLRRARRR